MPAHRWVPRTCAAPAANVDVYPIVVVAKGAASCVLSRGRGNRGQGNLQVFRINTPDRSDPANLTRLWSAGGPRGHLITNELWVCRIEVAATGPCT